MIVVIIIIYKLVYLTGVEWSRMFLWGNFWSIMIFKKSNYIFKEKYRSESIILGIYCYRLIT